MTLGERLTYVRKSQNPKLNQTEFAERIGMTRAAYGMYEIDRAVPPASTMRLICLTYNVSERWLETGEGEPFLKPPDDELTEAVRALMPYADEADIATFAALAQLPKEWWDMFHQAVERERAKLKG